MTYLISAENSSAFEGVFGETTTVAFDVYRSRVDSAAAVINWQASPLVNSSASDFVGNRTPSGAVHFDAGSDHVEIDAAVVGGLSGRARLHVLPRGKDRETTIAERVGCCADR